MARNYAEHARVTAICVNLALDAVEADIVEALEAHGHDIKQVLACLLERLKARRINHSEFKDANLIAV